MESLQQLMWYIQVYEEQFARERMEQLDLQEKKKLTEKCRELDKAKQLERKARFPELETALNSTIGKANDLQKFIDRG